MEIFTRYINERADIYSVNFIQIKIADWLNYLIYTYIHFLLNIGDEVFMLLWTDIIPARKWLLYKSKNYSDTEVTRKCCYIPSSFESHRVITQKLLRANAVIPFACACYRYDIRVSTQKLMHE